MFTSDVRCRPGLRQAVRTTAPVGDLGLVDLVPHVVTRGETRCGADRAVHVDHPAADSADQMVVIVTDAIFEARRGAGRLNAPDEAFSGEEAKGVVDRLERDGTDLGSDCLGDIVGREVRLTRDRPQDRQSLGRDLNPTLTKKLSRIVGHSAIE